MLVFSTQLISIVMQMNNNLCKDVRNNVNINWIYLIEYAFTYIIFLYLGFNLGMKFEFDCQDYFTQENSRDFSYYFDDIYNILFKEILQIWLLWWSV